jgi:DNA-binding response OmpR family regulator
MGGAIHRPERAVLVVDDDPGVRGFVAMVLRAEGYRVLTAADGVEALEWIARQRPDRVLLDLAMPVMDGWQVLHTLRERRVNVPLVFMSAGYNARVEAERHGADGYLGKPFTRAELLAVVARFVSAVPS